MKKLIFMGILGLFALGACNNKNTQGHEGHGHNTVTHNNDEHMKRKVTTMKRKDIPMEQKENATAIINMMRPTITKALLPDTMKLPKPPTATKSSSRKRKPMLPE